jgi:hypothetical protein
LKVNGQIDVSETLRRTALKRSREQSPTKAAAAFTFAAKDMFSRSVLVFLSSVSFMPCKLSSVYPRVAIAFLAFIKYRNHSFSRKAVKMDSAPLALFVPIVLAPVFGGAYSWPTTLLFLPHMFPFVKYHSHVR